MTFCKPLGLWPSTKGHYLHLTLQDRLTTPLEGSDTRFDITNGILTVRQLAKDTEGFHILTFYELPSPNQIYNIYRGSTPPPPLYIEYQQPFRIREK